MVIYYKHHIIPKHANGTDDPLNITMLTIEEHAEAHRKLFEQYGRWQDKLAWKMLSGVIGKEEGIKIAQGKGRKPHNFGKPMPEKQRLQLSKSQKGKRPPNFGKPMTETQKEKISIARLGQKQTKETIQKKINAISKKWIIYPPKDLACFLVTNLKQFCKENNFNYSLLNRVASGFRSHHKNYRCQKLESN